MKTLDEVIDDLKMKCRLVICNRPKDDYWVVPIETIRDALHYLKAYRELDSLDAVAFPEDDNPPLTWDELKQMEGKPVWVEGSAFANGQWIILGGCYENGGAEYVFIDGDQYWKEDMKDADDGVSWQAYRKER